MRKLLICFLLFSTNLFAQYTNDDYDLVELTYTKDFDTAEILDNLFSDNEQKVIAGILTAGNSKDTTYLRFLTSLDFNKFGDHICFALAQIGKSEFSTEFLISKIFTENNKFLHDCYEAIGKVGSKKTLSFLLNNKDYKSSSYDGLSLGIYNFYSRDIKHRNGAEFDFLREQIKSGKTSEQQKYEALFTLYRIGPAKVDVKLCTNVLKNKSSSYNKFAKMYALKILYKLKTFPSDPTLFNSLLTNTEWLVRASAVDAISFLKFNDFKDIKTFALKVKDANSNVAKQAASALRRISIPDELKVDYKNLLFDLLNNSFLSTSTFGELFISYCALFPDEIYELIKVYEQKINRKFLFRTLGLVQPDPHTNFNYLKERLWNADASEQIEIFDALLLLQDSLSNEPQFESTLLNAFSGNDPNLISIVSSSLSSKIISNNKTILSDLILMQVRNNIENSGYSEALINLLKLSKKVSKSTEQRTLNMLLESENYNVLKYLKEKYFIENIDLEKDEDIFETIWKYSFLYKSATVTTSAGSFTFNLLPEVAPISVGNFVKLASQGYFNEVKFHRVVSTFVIQTGDPSGTGWGGPGYEIITEPSNLPFNVGYVGMASSGLDTEGSQWFVMNGNYPHLNSRYTVFGKVISGQSVVDNIDIDDKIKSIKFN